MSRIIRVIIQKYLYENINRKENNNSWPVFYFCFGTKTLELFNYSTRCLYFGEVETPYRHRLEWLVTSHIVAYWSTDSSPWYFFCVLSVLTFFSRFFHFEKNFSWCYFLLRVIFLYSMRDPINFHNLQQYEMILLSILL